MTAYDIFPIDEIERRHQGHWFSHGAKNFFNSRWETTYYRVGNKGYFVSSERHQQDPRRYTIREYDFIEDTITTVGDFQQFATKKEAKTYIRNMILNMEDD